MSQDKHGTGGHRTGGRVLGGEELAGTNVHPDEFGRFHAPYRNVEITLIDKPSDEVPLMELRIREGRRITMVELDQKTVADLATSLQDWANKQG